MSRRMFGRNQSRSVIDLARMIRWFIAGIVSTLVLVALTLLGVARYLVNQVTKPRKQRRPVHYTFTPWEFQIPYQTIRIPIDGEELDIWYMPRNDAKAAILLLGGYRSEKSELLGIGSALYRSGFSCALFDYRGTGRPSGDVITLGHHETEDARVVLDWLAEHVPDKQIGVIGYSLGGSVAINLTASDPRINAVVSDCAFSSQYGVLAHQVRNVSGLWPAPILTAAAPMFRRRHRRSYKDFAPVDVVHMVSPRPFLLIHSKNDTMVPFSEGLKLWEHAGDPKEFWAPEDVGHCGAYFADREGYSERVATFFTKALLENCRASVRGEE